MPEHSRLPRHPTRSARKLPVLIACLSLVVGLSAGADPIGYTVGDLRNGSNLFSTNWFCAIDLATGELMPIARVLDPRNPGQTMQSIDGLDFDPLTGRLYAVTGLEEFFELDPTTGQVVGPILTLTDSVSGDPLNKTDYALAFTPSGVLYISAGGSGPFFGTLEKTTGVVTSLLAGGTAARARGLAVAPDGTIYGTHYSSPPTDVGLVEIATNGTWTPIGPLGSPMNNNIGLDFDPSGVLWGIEAGGVTSTPVNSTIFVVNHATAALTVIALPTETGTGLQIRSESLAVAMTDAVVQGGSNPWLAGMPNGSTDSGTDLAPDQSPVQVTTVDVSQTPALLFDATGGTHFDAGCPIPATFPACSPADGGATTGAHLVTLDGVSNGIANLVAPYSALVGVFLDDDPPDISAAPSGLDFSTSGIGLEFPVLSPQLKQPFFIGDGRTSALVPQIFVVPNGATRLYLATHDGFGWNNNTGKLDVTVTPTAAPPAVPSASWPGLFVLALSLAVAARRRLLGVAV